MGSTTRDRDNLDHVAETFRCTTCGGPPKPRNAFYERPGRGRRPVSYDCKTCRKGGRDREAEHFRAQFKRYGQLCGACFKPARIASNGGCRACNRERGLKECRECRVVRPRREFWKGRAVCRSCS